MASVSLQLRIVTNPSQVIGAIPKLSRAQRLTGKSLTRLPSALPVKHGSSVLLSETAGRIFGGHNQRLVAGANQKQLSESTRPMSVKAAGSTAVETATPAAKDGEARDSMEGKIVVVTGANTGMGIVIAKELALKGAHVVLACRSESKGRAAEESVWREVRATGASGKAEFAALDLARLSSVREFADWFLAKYDKLDCLINNAGIMIPPHSYTPDGFESQFQVNHLSHYLLTRLLLPALENTAGTPSIVHISSLAGERVSVSKGEFNRIARCTPEDYDAWTAYRQSKLAQVLFTVEMNRRIGEMVTVNAVHPGIVNTELFNRTASPVVKALLGPLGWVLQSTGAVYSPEKGAQTAIYLATTPRDKTGSGGYFADCAPKPANPVAFDADLGLEWWEESAKLVGMDP